MLRLFNLLVFGLGLVVLPAQAQQNASPDAAPDSGAVVRTIDLAIADKHMLEDDLHHAAALTLHEAEPARLDVFVGAGIEARRLDLRLQGVYGLVRFRADPAGLRKRLHLTPRP